MTDFVERCRREWHRLAVPGPVAEEMAADLSADLKEVEADGLSAEDLLGNSAFDPESFAASWAAERGIIPESPNRQKAWPPPLIPFALIVIAAIVVVVAALQLTQSGPGAALLSHERPPHVVAPAGAFAAPADNGHVTNSATPVGLIVLVLAIIALGVAAWLFLKRRRTQPPLAAA